MQNDLQIGLGFGFNFTD